MMTLVPAVPAAADDDSPGPTTPPIPPNVAGCYLATGGVTGAVTGPPVWQPVACMSPDVLAHVLRPTQGGGVGIPGIWSKPKPIVPFFKFAPPLQGGSVVIRELSGGVETDSISGPGAFSIQTNTNTFPGLNGHTDWVQFTDQTDFNNAASAYNALCIWNVDITVARATNNQQGYSPTCVPVPGGPRGGFWQAGTPADVTGSISYTPFGPLLQAVASLPWTNQSYYAVVTGDQYGLAYGNWHQVSGTELGMGAGSAEAFSPSPDSPAPVLIETTVDARSCFPTGPNCPTFPLFTLQGYGNIVDPVVTAETNNLSIVRQPTMACAVNDCSIDYESGLQ